MNIKTTMPQAWQLRLSDAFGDRRGAMELIVEVLNINETAGNDILARCAPLKAYSTFVAKVRQIVAAGNLLSEAIPAAMRYCIDNGYLVEYFMAKQETEVFDMVNFQWDADLALEVRTEEAREEAMAQGLAEGMEKGMAQGMEKGMVQGVATSIRNVMKSMSFSMEKAMDVLQIPMADRAKYAALLKG